MTRVSAAIFGEQGRQIHPYRREIHDGVSPFGWIAMRRMQYAQPRPRTMSRRTLAQLRLGLHFERTP
jgi:hypothetical protein